MAFAAVQVSLKETTYSTISVTWRCKLPTPVGQFALRLTQANGCEPKETKVPGTVFAFEITHLTPGLMYQLQIAPEVAGRTLSWSRPLFAQTKPHPKHELLVTSERLVNEDCGEWREVVMGRRARGWEDYAKSSFKFARPKSHREVRVRRMMVLSSAMEVLAENGYPQLDDYFQGPLYKDNE